MNETLHIENYLLRTLPPEEQLLMDAKLLVDETLREKLAWQEKTYRLVKAYGRKSLREEIENVHRKLFTEKKHESFREKIRKLFS